MCLISISHSNARYNLARNHICSMIRHHIYNIEKVKVVDRDNIQASLNTLRYIQQTVVHNSERQ